MESMGKHLLLLSGRCSGQWFPRSCAVRLDGQHAGSPIHPPSWQGTKWFSWLRSRRSSPQERRSGADRNRPPDNGTGNGRQTKQSVLAVPNRLIVSSRSSQLVYTPRRWRYKVLFLLSGRWHTARPASITQGALQAFFRDSQTCLVAPPPHGRTSISSPEDVLCGKSASFTKNGLVLALISASKPSLPKVDMEMLRLARLVAVVVELHIFGRVGTGGFELIAVWIPSAFSFG